MTLNEIITIITAHKPELMSTYKIKSIGVFGSYVRGEQKDDSDIDILVEFAAPVSLFDHGGLQYHMNKLLQNNTDVIDKDELLSEYKDIILKEVRYI